MLKALKKEQDNQGSFGYKIQREKCIQKNFSTSVSRVSLLPPLIQPFILIAVIAAAMGRDSNKL